LAQQGEGHQRLGVRDASPPHRRRPTVDRRKAPDAVLSLPAPAPPSPSPTRRPVVLWAEDEPSDQVLIRDACAELGTCPEIEFVEDGVPLVEAAVRKRPHLIVLDINMPMMGGVEALMQLRRHRKTQDTPIVLFSTNRSPEHVSLYKGLGATAYVEKPLHLARYPGAVAEILRHARAIKSRG
jgi:CheY-like chemotaxis protein